MAALSSQEGWFMAGSVGALMRFVQSQTTQAQSDPELLRSFVECRDQRAFAELVQRYGPLVFGICRRILRDSHEAEDAFQATFLLLCRRAASLRQPDRLGSWLHAVACRIAGKALRRGWRRGVTLEPQHDSPMPINADGEAMRELRPILDEAVRALPAKYREPIILCYLQGLTNADAARRLGCPLGTIAIRLSRARDQLRSRLGRRGVVLPAALFPVLLSKTAAVSSAPISLYKSTVAQVAAPAAATITQLIEGIGKTMLVEKSRWFAGALVVLSACTVGLVSYHSGASEPARPAVKAEDAPAGAPNEKPAVIAVVNFIVECEEPRCARLVAEMAELHRKRIAEQWLGKELPKWTKPCKIHVKIKAEGAKGATTMAFDDGISLSMLLQGPLDRILADTLPHEVTHTVMATHFGKPVPRWADEGIAMMSESPEERTRHLRQAGELVNHVFDNRLVRPNPVAIGMFPLKDLMPMRSFPDNPLYAEVLCVQGHSLASFLVERSDRATLLGFVKDGMEGDWNKAAAKHYGFRDLDEMESLWRQSLAPAIPAAPPKKEPTAMSFKGVQPTIVHAVARTAYDDRTGVKITPITILRTYARTRNVTTYEQRTTDGKTYIVPVTGERNEMSYTESSYAAKDVKAFELDGTPIETTAVLERLTKETPVLLSTSGKVSPFYLQIIKAGTMVLVIPEEPGIHLEEVPPALLTPAITVPGQISPQ
jgi:RNA polymerase sigma factor (sigma-70 family)